MGGWEKEIVLSGSVVVLVVVVDRVLGITSSDFASTMAKNVMGRCPRNQGLAVRLGTAWGKGQGSWLWCC